jgi:hypothetical protein
MFRDTESIFVSLETLTVWLYVYRHSLFGCVFGDTESVFFIFRDTEYAVVCIDTVTVRLNIYRHRQYGCMFRETERSAMYLQTLTAQLYL